MTRRGLTYDEAIRLGLGDEHPDSPRQRQAAPAKRPTRARHQIGEQNKTEARYDAHLVDLKAMGRIEAFAFEPFKLRLAGRCWLLIDFAVRTRAGVVLIDVKGFMEGDAAVKLKVCAERYPWMPLYLVYYERREWRYRSVSRSGIGAWCAEPF